MECPFRSLWNAIAEAIRSQVNPDTFQRWFADIELVATDEESLTLRVPNHIYQLWIESNYQQLVQSSITSVLGQPRRIKFVHGESANASSGNGAKASGLESVREGTPQKPSKTQSQPLPTIPAEADGPVAANGMNPRNTFDSFVVGANNQFAHAAAVAVAQALARTYNPLFVYGGVGLGKTHLMQAIGQYVLGHKKGIKVVYLSSEKFTNEFIDAIQQSTLVKFRRKYRQADLLLIDDIQFLAGRERTQEEFFHTFNTLFEGHKQIVLSSDRPASEIQNLESRLVSRFEWGLTAELQAPDIETRLAILRKKAGALGVKLESSVMEFLAERIRTNVRRLEGALLRVASFASLSGKELNRDSIEHLLKDILHEEARKTVTVDQIQRKVAEHYDIRVADMTSKRRPANIAFPRQVAMYLARELTQSSLSEIGEAFGGRDHGTVLHACKLVKGKIAAEEATRRVVSLIDSQLKR